MEADVARQLAGLNRQFYQTFALQFSATRQRLQPGVLRVLDGLPPHARILDLGCGNGELRRALVRREQSGLYVGLDFSPPLLEEARADDPAEGGGQLASYFFAADLSGPAWPAVLGEIPEYFTGSPPAFDYIMSFAALHHLPGRAARLGLLSALPPLLAEGGRFIHSEWQFLNSPRLAARVQPWELAGLTARDVDPGDYLLDWRSGGSGLRYVHHFSEPELEALAGAAGFRVVETFYSDGENSRLAIYQVWEKEG